MDLAPKKETPLSEYLQMGLEKKLEDLDTISSQASKEYAVEKALEKMKQQWESMQLTFASYKETGEYASKIVKKIRAQNAVLLQNRKLNELFLCTFNSMQYT